MNNLYHHTYEKILDFLSLKSKRAVINSMTHLISEIFNFQLVFFLESSLDQRLLNYRVFDYQGHNYKDISFLLDDFKHPFSQVAYQKNSLEIEANELKVWQKQSQLFNDLVISAKLDEGIVIIPLFYQDELLYGSLVLSLRDYRHHSMDLEYLRFFITLTSLHLKNIESYRLKEDEGLYLTRSIARSEHTYLSYLKKTELQKIIIATTPEMDLIVSKISQIINSDISILFSGETGTGKSFLAKVCHEYSLKQNMPCIIVDCGEKHLDWEERFFNSDGFLSQSFKGVLILENVTELSGALQKKLASAFLEKYYFAIDSNSLLPCETRIVTTTREDHMGLLKNKLLRPDFFAQISQVIFSLPQIKERKDDIKFFIEKYITEFNENSNSNKQLIGYNDQFLAKLYTLDWGENIHELYRYLELNAFHSSDGVLKVQKAVYGKSIRAQQKRLTEEFVDALLAIEHRHLEIGEILQNIEAYLIKEELKNNKGKRQLVANKLKIPLRTLAYKCQKYGL